MQPKRPVNPFRLGVQVGLAGLLLVAGLNYQAILDQYALQTFKPAANVADIEGRLDLTTKAKATLYRAEPRIDNKTSFNIDCDTRPHELELGCFYRSRIYILQIDNPSLATEMDVVTAHELMHAAWVRMSPSERNTLGAELTRVYEGLNDSDLKQRMAGYAKSEPGEEANELHSILGTEYASLSPVLEAHYAKYFTNRSVIVAAHEAYQNVFNSRRKELERELAQIRSQKAQLGLLNRQMESYKVSGQVELYNALVPRQNRMVDDINKQIAVYRQGVEEYNSLSKSLDSQEITDTETSAQ
jgi:hypothetical protein